MSDLVKRDTDSWADVLPAVGDLAGKIAATDFVPDAMRGKTAVVAAAILYGRELGLGPMTSLRSINVIKGKPALSAEAMRAMILAAGHHISFREMTQTRCVVDGRRKGETDVTTVSYSMDDAKKAGLAGQNQYAKMPRQMLAARATSELARLIFADVIGGLLIDVEAEEDEPGEPTNVTPITTAKRRKAPTSPVEAADAPPADPAPVDPEPVLDDDIIDAEIIESDELADWEKELLAPPMSPEVRLLKEKLDAEVIDDGPSGPALAREALKAAKESGPAQGPITAPQLKALQAGFKACGVDDRAERLGIAAKLAGRHDLTSANDLTAAEAKDILMCLDIAKGTNDPRATLQEAAK